MKRDSTRREVQGTEQRPDHVVSIHMDVPVQRVWNEITKTGRVQRALFNTVLETDLEPGSLLRYYSPNHERVFIVGEVVEVDPPRKFSHTYWFTTWKRGGPTLVTWELAEEAGGCRVTITHSGWTPDHDVYEQTAGGWRQILELLKQELETGRIPLRSRVMFAVMGWMSFMLPRTTQAEHADAAWRERGGGNGWRRARGDAGRRDDSPRPGPPAGTA